MFIKAQSAYFVALPKDEDAGLPLTWVNLASVDEAYTTDEGGVVLVRQENTEHYRGIQAEYLTTVFNKLSEVIKNV